MEGRPQHASRSRSREEGARGRETAATAQVHRAGQDGPPEGPTPELPHVPRYLPRDRHVSTATIWSLEGRGNGPSRRWPCRHPIPSQRDRGGRTGGAPVVACRMTLWPNTTRWYLGVEQKEKTPPSFNVAPEARTERDVFCLQ